ncbi:hypothetical protein [Dyella caseinilytica]|uniref:Uncharacterized protein n=1 Tax=Dyella caseinilytica TaxID=1849581 RepID=A0ABX7GZB2_9GAMM|nr:hypothetical protein [Dyella caseinilytica]QRN55634.1 hypothetical protein ISN74_10085 [Dyella caseinilytica]GGA03284.1 hypothetical protein GCM10011408_25990 [Dyella caseinilytica]
MNILIGVASVPEDIELRLSLACGLLAASQLHVQVSPWKGQPCDVLVVDMESGYGRLAREVGKRRNLTMLGFGRSGSTEDIPGLRRLDRQAPAAAIAKTLQEILVPSKGFVAGDIQGLLGICLHENGSDEAILARHGSTSVVLRPDAGRIHARSMSDLLAAEARLLDLSWLSSTRTQKDAHESEWLVSRSIESFLVVACRRHQAYLPMLGEAPYRLNHWPDLGGISDDLHSLRLAALLYLTPWSVGALAKHLGLHETQVNAFFWATLASGALLCTDETATGTAIPSAPTSASSILQRVARHFGLKIGHAHA